jgi:hypothetical protein
MTGADDGRGDTSPATITKNTGAPNSQSREVAIARA